VGLALALPACVLDTKVGDQPILSTSDSGDSSTGDIGDESGPGSASSTMYATTGGPETTTTTTGATTDEPGTVTGSSGASGSGSTTEGPTGDCVGLDEAACTADPTCMPIHGTPYDVQPCPDDLKVYLGCMPQQGCDDGPATICTEPPGMVYEVSSQCIPAGFALCAIDGAELCGSACAGLPGPQCVHQGHCTAHLGAPHVVQDGEACVDLDNPQFLACEELLGECPPVVQTVCPQGQEDPVFDVGSGCIPPGFEPCGEGGLPGCA
jgi:hypothetical protein